MSALDWCRDFGLGGHVLDDGRFQATAVVTPAPLNDDERKIEEHFLERFNNLGTWLLFSLVIWAGIIYVVWKVIF